MSQHRNILEAMLAAVPSLRAFAISGLISAIWNLLSEGGTQILSDRHQSRDRAPAAISGFVQCPSCMRMSKGPRGRLLRPAQTSTSAMFKC
jgi:hypothetical protein